MDVSCAEIPANALKQTTKIRVNCPVQEGMVGLVKYHCVNRSASEAPYWSTCNHRPFTRFFHSCVFGTNVIPTRYPLNFTVSNSRLSKRSLVRLLFSSDTDDYNSIVQLYEAEYWPSTKPWPWLFNSHGHRPLCNTLRACVLQYKTSWGCLSHTSNKYNY